MLDLDSIFDDDRTSVCKPPINWARKASALLARVADPERRADLRYQFEERAAICEFDAHISRDESERLAFDHVRRIIEMEQDRAA